ncbi:hypothetical protein ElyMa_006720400 [Elysia marginata]|uniref:Uncharacterized protein n=1 Tax=Elysia marginata TaxID=1093978 RepID=A0AAV4IWJ0_9GAST|nr:hypothetical protein ElyMa_006720400 [Elysia marginata]
MSPLRFLNKKFHGERSLLSLQLKHEDLSRKIFKSFDSALTWAQPKKDGAHLSPFAALAFHSYQTCTHIIRIGNSSVFISRPARGSNSRLPAPYSGTVLFDHEDCTVCNGQSIGTGRGGR